jgi:hypothetical protein
VQVAEGQRPNPASLVVTFAAYFVAAVATAMLAEATGSDRFEEGVALGLVAGIGYSLTLLGVGAVFEKRPQTSTWLAINGVYNVLGLLIVAVIVTVWD